MNKQRLYYNRTYCVALNRTCEVLLTTHHLIFLMVEPGFLLSRFGTLSFSQVLGCLPKKHEKVICCEMIEAQKRIYSNLLRQFREVVSGEIAASSRLMQLRQVSNHPLLYRSHYTDDLVIQIGKVLCKEVIFIIYFCNDPD